MQLFATFTELYPIYIMDVKIAPDWKEILAPEFDKPYFGELTRFAI